MAVEPEDLPARVAQLPVLQSELRMSWIERADGTADDFPDYWEPTPAERPPLDPEEHAGRELTPEERVRRAELLASTREANQAHRRLW